MVFPVVMYRCENWTIKKAEHQRIDAFELCWRRLKSPLDCKEIIPVNPKSTLNIHRKDWCWSWSSNNLATRCEELTQWKNSDAGKDWGQEEKGETEDEMVGWHHWLNGHEFEQTPGDSEGQGSQACWSSWGHKELDMTEWLNWTKLIMWFSNYVQEKSSCLNCNTLAKI